MDKFLETIAEPLADLMRAAANWLDRYPAYDEGGELPEGLSEVTNTTGRPEWIINERGQAVPRD